MRKEEEKRKEAFLVELGVRGRFPLTHGTGQI